VRCCAVSIHVDVTTTLTVVVPLLGRA